MEVVSSPYIGKLIDIRRYKRLFIAKLTGVSRLIMKGALASYPAYGRLRWRSLQPGSISSAGGVEVARITVAMNDGQGADGRGVEAENDL